jgi:hypothetical protein
MAAPAYATVEDIYRYGLPRGLLSNPARLVHAVRPAQDTVELDGHGIATGTPLRFRAEEGGTLPAPLTDGATYYGIRVDDARFQVAAAPAGPAIDFTTAGTLVLVWSPIEPLIEAELERYSRIADTYLPAHAVPLVAPFPSFIVGCVAKLAAASLLEICGQSSELVQASATETRRELARLAKGIPLRDERATPPANLAVGKNVVTPSGGGGGLYSALAHTGTCGGGLLP